MIKKLENNIGNFLNLSCTMYDKEKIIPTYITEIKKLKNFPFTKVFITVPIFVLDMFLKKAQDSGLMYKELQLKNKTAYIQY